MYLVEQGIDEIFAKRVQETPERIAIETRDFFCSWGELEGLVDRWASYLFHQGIKWKDHVGICATNSPSWVVSFLAILRIGGIPILLNTYYKGEEMSSILAYSHTKYLLYGRRYPQEALDVLKERQPDIIYILMEEEAILGNSPFDKVNRESLALIPKKNVHEIACMLFTSGTTSMPKGVCLSHYNIVNNARAIVDAMEWTKEDKMCISVPMFHCFGLTASIMACIVSGASMYILPYFKTDLVWQGILESKSTILNGVPSMFLAMLHNENYKNERVDSLRSGIVAGSPILEEDYRRICQRFPNMKLQPSYGQTETSPCISIAKVRDSLETKEISCGSIIDHVSVRMMNPRTNLPCQEGEIGEIQVQGYNVMLGYYQLPKDEVWTKDGWLATGDLGYLDKEGQLYITGRLKEMIIRAGENIAPKEIEEVIVTIPEILAVKVVGVPSPVLQEEICACIIVKEGQVIQEDRIRQYVAKQLADYKVPSYILFMNEFPMNGSGKIQLSQLKDKVSIILSNKDKIKG